MSKVSSINKFTIIPIEFRTCGRCPAGGTANAGGVSGRAGCVDGVNSKGVSECPQNGSLLYELMNIIHINI